MKSYATELRFNERKAFNVFRGVDGKPKMNFMQMPRCDDNLSMEACGSIFTCYMENTWPLECARLMRHTSYCATRLTLLVNESRLREQQQNNKQACLHV